MRAPSATSATRSGERCATSRKSVARLAPDVVGDLDDEAQLGELLVDAQVIAFHSRGEATLGRQTELVDVDELRGFLDPALDRVGVLELAALRRDEAEHDLLALRDEPQRSEAARPLVVPLHEEAVDLELVEERLGDEVVAAFRRPR